MASTSSNWSLRVWKTDDGLPNNGVNGIAQTSDGFLWVATESSLARFDGFRFEDFSPQINPVAHNQSVVALTTGESNSLWLATERGIIINLSARGMQVFTNGLPDKLAETLTVDPNGACWITYRDGSVCRIDHDAVTNFKIPDQLPGSRFTSFAVDNKNRLWLGKGASLGTIHDEKFNPLSQVDYSHGGIIAIARANFGGLWVYYGEGIFKYKDGELQECGSPGVRLPGSTVLFEDSRSNLWIGSETAGLICYDGSQFTQVPTSGRYVTSILEDREGNLWVGTSGGGLDRINPRIVSVEGPNSGAPFEMVDSICQDAGGAIWVAAHGVLTRMDKGVWEDMTKQPTWPGGDANCVAVDRQGIVWIGTVNRRYIRWYGGAFHPSGKANDVRGQVIHALLAAQNGDIYLGEERSNIVQRFRNGQMSTLPLAGDIGITRAMAEDAAGNVWIGTDKGALVRVDGDSVTNVAPPTEDAFFSIRSLYPGKDGGVWIGYGGAGIGRFKDGRLTRVSSAQGLPNNYISQIMADDRGWLWCGSDHGVFRVQQQELESTADGHLDRVRSILNGRQEGETGLQANYGFGWPGTLHSSDGRIWMAMRNALAIVNPDRVQDDLTPSPVLLTRVVMDDQTLAGYGGVIGAGGALDLGRSETALRLPPRYRRVRFEFTALSLRAPENVRFRYRLEGLDDEWSRPTSSRVISYSRLAAGNYQFQVMGCNSSGIWNKNIATVAFTVEPFFWQTWWFRFTTLALLVLTVVAVVRYVSFRRLRLRLRLIEQQAALDRERARIAKDLHDDLGSRVTRLVLLNELTLQNRVPPENVMDHAREISDTARQMIQSLDETVWAVNPRNDVLPHLLNYLGQFAIDYLKHSGVRCRIDFPVQVPDQKISTEARHHLCLALKEALNNTLRHAGATEVWLRTMLTADGMVLEIADNGRGFEHVPDNATADGLRNMRQRMEEISGQFHLDSAPGRGTVIRLTLRFAAPTR
ncbi:MAG TPA: two-component regulator propeller domain-containing protein [Desulfuromonadaceae bacterium]|nr:two-component regulator propeller domain-containing protein [Desulfuromonadaceae bacterium]